MTTPAIETAKWRVALRRSAADWLCLAAAPTFAIMALLTAVHGADPQGMLCAAMQSRSPLNGMAWMYLLMRVFHSAPWLKLIASCAARRA